MKHRGGATMLPTNAVVGKAYCEGRKASVAGAALNTNPHGAGTPEALAWSRGWRLYASAGTTTVQDSCASPAKFTVPTITATPDAGDTTGKTYDFSLTSAGYTVLPCEFHFGDGSPAHFADMGTAKHTFPGYVAYPVKLLILGSAVASTTVTPVDPGLLREPRTPRKAKDAPK